MEVETKQILFFLTENLTDFTGGLRRLIQGDSTSTVKSDILSLWCNKKKNTSNGLIDDILQEYLYLWHITMLNCKESKWNIQRLKLKGNSVMENLIVKIRELEINGFPLGISSLPPTIKKLHLDETEVCNEQIEVPSLKYLTLKSVSDINSFLSSFQSVNLTHLHFYWVQEVNVDQLPKSIAHIKITRVVFADSRIVAGEVRRVDKLILERFTFKQIEELLPHFQTDELVVSNLSVRPHELIELTKKGIKRIAIGRMNCFKQDFSTLSRHVDKIADYYLWEGGRGKVIEEVEFKELTKLY